MQPKTRKEQFLAAIAGETEEIPSPVTREEIYLSKIYEKGGAGGEGMTTAEFNRKTNAYLQENNYVTADDVAELIGEQEFDENSVRILINKGKNVLLNPPKMTGVNSAYLYTDVRGFVPNTAYKVYLKPDTTVKISEWNAAWFNGPVNLTLSPNGQWVDFTTTASRKSLESVGGWLFRISSTNSSVAHTFENICAVKATDWSEGMQPIEDATGYIYSIPYSLKRTDTVSERFVNRDGGWYKETEYQGVSSVTSVKLDVRSSAILTIAANIAHSDLGYNVAIVDENNEPIFDGIELVPEEKDFVGIADYRFIHKGKEFKINAMTESTWGLLNVDSTATSLADAAFEPFLFFDLVAMGFDTVQFSIFNGIFVSNHALKPQSEYQLALDAIDFAIAMGLRVILKFYSFAWGGASTTADTMLVEKMFIDKYKENKAVIGYSVANEPGNCGFNASDATIVARYDSFMRDIQKYITDNTTQIMFYEQNTDSLAHNLGNTAFEHHYYSPMAFSHASYYIRAQTMPAASSSLVNKIYQYIGTTNNTYTKGKCYICVKEGSNYVWQLVDAYILRYPDTKFVERGSTEQGSPKTGQFYGTRPTGTVANIAMGGSSGTTEWQRLCAGRVKNDSTYMNELLSRQNLVLSQPTNGNEYFDIRKTTFEFYDADDNLVRTQEFTISEHEDLSSYWIAWQKSGSLQNPASSAFLSVQQEDNEYFLRFQLRGETDQSAYIQFAKIPRASTTAYINTWQVGFNENEAYVVPIFECRLHSDASTQAKLYPSNENRHYNFVICGDADYMRKRLEYTYNSVSTHNEPTFIGEAGVQQSTYLHTSTQRNNPANYTFNDRNGEQWATDFLKAADELGASVAWFIHFGAGFGIYNTKLLYDAYGDKFGSPVYNRVRTANANRVDYNGYQLTTKLDKSSAYGRNAPTARAVYSFVKEVENKVDAKPDTSAVPIVGSLPTASADYLDTYRIYKGTSASRYVGGLYQCQEVTPSTDPKTYKWELVGVPVGVLKTAFAEATDFADLKTKIAAL